MYRTAPTAARAGSRVLFVNDSTGAIDLVMDPSNVRILYAATWQIEIHTWGRESGGAGSAIWKSVDGGTTWKRLACHGLPETPVGKIGLGIARSNPNRLYALIETGDGVPVHGKDAGTGGALAQRRRGGHLGAGEPRPPAGLLYRAMTAGWSWPQYFCSRISCAFSTSYMMVPLPSNCARSFASPLPVALKRYRPFSTPSRMLPSGIAGIGKARSYSEVVEDRFLIDYMRRMPS